MVWLRSWSWTIDALAPAAPEPELRASVHARFQYGPQVIGASRCDPGLQLPTDFFRRTGIEHRAIDLDLHELPGVASWAFDTYLGPVSHSLLLLLLYLLLHRIAPFWPLVCLDAPFDIVITSCSCLPLPQLRRRSLLLRLWTCLRCFPRPRWPVQSRLHPPAVAGQRGQPAACTWPLPACERPGLAALRPD